MLAIQAGNRLQQTTGQVCRYIPLSDEQAAQAQQMKLVVCFLSDSVSHLLILLVRLDVMVTFYGYVMEAYRSPTFYEFGAIRSMHQVILE